MAEASTAGVVFVKVERIVIAGQVTERLDVVLSDRLRNRSPVTYFDFHGLFCIDRI
jgi:hypothetical protein